MPKYIVRDNMVYFRQSFERAVLCNLFTTLYALGLSIGEGMKHYPHSVQISKSEFLSVLELAKGE
jgi:hypothetical protein